MRRGLRPYVIACVAIIWLVSAACSLIGDESSSCDTNKGEETLEAAGLGTEGLTVVEDCTDVYEGLREGEVRTVVARGDEASVNGALQLGSVDPSRASSSPFEAQEVPPSFDVSVTPPDQEWRDGDRLIHRDQIEFRGRAWDRYVEWGRQQGSDDYMVAVVLETGSM